MRSVQLWSHERYKNPTRFDCQVVMSCSVASLVVTTAGLEGLAEPLSVRASYRQYKAYLLCVSTFASLPAEGKTQRQCGS